MSVISITASVECDECGARFKATLDEARKLPMGWTLFDEVEDVVRGGDPLGHGPLFAPCSVQDGKMLCKECTKAADRKAAADSG